MDCDGVPTMTSRRSLLPRTDACCVCGASVTSTSATTDDPEAPEMVRLPAGAWFGMVEDRPGAETRLVVCCSDDCVNRLLTEEP